MGQEISQPPAPSDPGPYVYRATASPPSDPSARGSGPNVYRAPTPPLSDPPTAPASSPPRRTAPIPVPKKKRPDELDAQVAEAMREVFDTSGEPER